MAPMGQLPVTADLTLMRELNQALILSLVRQEVQISRAEIAKRTRLSRSTVSNIINELIEARRIFEIEKGESRGGRRPILLELNYRSHCAVGVELATNFLNLVITDLNAGIICRQSQPFDINAGPEIAAGHMRALVYRALGEAGIDRSAVAGVGVGVPGPLSYETGRTIAPPIMPGWGGVSLRDLFNEALDLPVIVDNDANLGALAEFNWGAAKGFRNIAYLYLGSTGIGAGLIANKTIYRGEIGSAGEIGHLMLDEHGPVCSCGSHGCLEALASLPRLLFLASELTGESITTLDQILQKVHHGDAQIRQLLETTGEHIGIAVANLLNLYNPGLVVIGGPLAAAGNLFFDTIRATAHKRALSITLEHCDIVPGQLGANAVTLGAASQIIQTVFSPSGLDYLVGQL